MQVRPLSAQLFRLWWRCGIGAQVRFTVGCGPQEQQNVLDVQTVIELIRSELDQVTFDAAKRDVDAIADAIKRLSEELANDPRFEGLDVDDLNPVKE